jgi:hypothetical protein
VWTNHTRASAKLHVVIDAMTRSPRQVRIAPGSSHDLSLMTLDACCIGSLYVFDLAYYQGKLFQKIIERGGHFLCRVKKDANFEILAAEEPAWTGQRHKAVVQAMHGRSFEAQVAYVSRSFARSNTADTLPDGRLTAARAIATSRLVRRTSPSTVFPNVASDHRPAEPSCIPLRRRSSIENSIDYAGMEPMVRFVTEGSDHPGARYRAR